MSKDDLFFAVGKALNAQPVDEVIPVLLTASARALIMDANGDMEKLAKKIARFHGLMLSQIEDMLAEDMAEAARSTKQ